MSKTFTITAIAAVFFAAACTVAQAGEPARAQVRAELAAARASGEMAALHGEDSGSAWLASQAGSGGAAQAFKRQAPASDALATALLGEDSGSAYLSATMPVNLLTRAQVLAEMRRARDSGELHALHSEDSGSGFLTRQRAWRDAVYAGPGIGHGTERGDVSAVAVG